MIERGATLWYFDGHDIHESIVDDVYYWDDDNSYRIDEVRFADGAYMNEDQIAESYEEALLLWDASLTKRIDRQTAAIANARQMLGRAEEALEYLGKERKRYIEISKRS